MEFHSSMEECEALCTKLGIMVGGQFQCFGNIQNLKSKYGKGYSLILKLKTNASIALEESENLAALNEKLEIVEKFIATRIDRAILKDRQNFTLFYQILLETSDTSSYQETATNKKQQSRTTQTIAGIFNLIEENKNRLELETYSLSQTSLEQIFLSFTSFATKNVSDTSLP
jgi:ATP-binding cassette subfamily A (ABC1) protein 3